MAADPGFPRRCGGRAREKRACEVFVNRVNEGTEVAARQRSEASSPDRLPVDERAKRANRLGRVWLSRVALGCADLINYQGCADRDNRQGCAAPDNRQECTNPDSRQGGNERGRVAPGTPGPQAPHERRRSEEERSVSRGTGATRGLSRRCCCCLCRLRATRGFQAVLSPRVADPTGPRRRQAN